jgi:hypothetical protein
MKRACVAIATLTLAACQQAEVKSPASERSLEGAAILQFYAAPDSVYAGTATSLCYSVENASEVRIDPPVETLTPALSRCISVAPAANTKYTLFAKGADGQEVSRAISVAIRQGKPVPPAEEDSGPRITDFTATPTEISAGMPVTFCFNVANADRVRLQPPVQSLGLAKSGCFSLSPLQTATYTLVAEAEGGKFARRSITITVH